MAVLIFDTFKCHTGSEMEFLLLEDNMDWLTELMQEVWRTRKVPQDWRNALLIPLFNKKDRKLCDNYRGISLFSVPRKVLALILLKRLQTIIDPQL